MLSREGSLAAEEKKEVSSLWQKQRPVYHIYFLFFLNIDYVSQPLL
jgi:hypothetical protein